MRSRDKLDIYSLSYLVGRLCADREHSSTKISTVIDLIAKKATSNS